MKRPIFALLDGNNFFVSCERLFRPDLKDRPVVVLSSNDGCVVARSNEAKALGIPMGAPAFKYRQLFKENRVVQFSANFELYGDISRRITQLLTTITPKIEVYSVDESFLDLSELPIKDYGQWGLVLSEQILRWIGVPVSIGVAPTKTLAKIAAERAKKTFGQGGCVSLLGAGAAEIRQHLQAVPLENVWGIGRRLSPRLRAVGLCSADDVSQLPPQVARSLMGGVRGEQLVRELNGFSCLSLDQEQADHKSIARTRTFGQDTNQPQIVEAALVNFTSQAAMRLRREGQLTRRASFFLTTSRHKPPYRVWSREVRLAQPSSDTGVIARALIEEFNKIFDPAVMYHRAGVWLHDFQPSNGLQTDFFGKIDTAKHEQSTNRMKAVDQINARYGKGHLYWAAEDLGKSWEPKYNLRSPRYTSSWDELPIVKIKS